MTSLDSPKVVIILVLIVGVAYGGWAFYQNSQSQNPDWQVNKTTSRKFPPHRVNLWSDPYPPRVGRTTFSVELDFVNLMNDKIDSIRYELTKTGNPDEVVRATETDYRESGPYRGRYSGSLRIPDAGEWLLKVHASWKDKQSVSEFTIEVRE